LNYGLKDCGEALYLHPHAGNSINEQEFTGVGIAHDGIKACTNCKS